MAKSFRWTCRDDAAARELAEKLAQAKPGRTVVVTDENGNEIHVAKTHREKR